MRHIEKAAIQCFNPTEEQMERFRKMIVKKKPFQVDSSVRPDPSGDLWERRMAAFEISRKMWPGTKDGLLTEFNRFLKALYFQGEDLDHRLRALPWNIKYHIDFRSKKNDLNEFVPPWKNFSTWLNQANWKTTDPVLNFQSWYAAQRNIPDTEYKRYKIDFL